MASLTRKRLAAIIHVLDLAMADSSESLTGYDNQESRAIQAELEGALEWAYDVWYSRKYQSDPGQEFQSSN